MLIEPALVMLILGVACALVSCGIYFEPHGNKPKPARIISILSSIVAVIGLWCVVAYNIAEEKVEQMLFVSVSEIGNAQFITYEHPDKKQPVVINVNAYFSRHFITGKDIIEVTIFSDGPYNGIYGRPKTKITVPPSWPTPPALLSPA